jgi:hypothetical protein
MIASIDPYQPFHAQGGIAVEMGAKRPVPTQSALYVIVGVAKDLAQRFTFCIALAPSTTPSPVNSISWVELRFEDAFPALSTSASSRIRLIAEAAIKAALDELRTELHKVLRQAGYDAV